MKESIQIEQAISYISGTREYQKCILLILVLGEISLASFIMSNSYLLPKIPPNCKPFTSSCAMDERFQNSASYDLDAIGSNEYQITYFRTSYFTGVLVGSLSITWLSDKYGRKPIIKYTCILGMLSYISAAFAVNMTMLSIAGFGIGALEIGFYVMSFVLFAEIMDSKYRNWYLGAYKTFWPFAAGTFSLLYMLRFSWRYATLLSGLFLGVECLLLRFVYESPRFILTNLADVPAATQVIKEISLINGVGIFPYTLKSENLNTKRSLTVRDIFGSRDYMIKLTICSVALFCLVFATYGQIFIMPDITTNIYLQGIFMYTADLLSTFPTVYVVNTIGRKITTIVCFIITSACCFIISLFVEFVEDQDALQWSVIVFSVLSRLALSGEYFLIYIYIAELFPTYFRGTAIGICNFTGRFGGIAASNIGAISGAFGISSSTTLGGAMMVGAFFCLFLPETNGKPMMEMIKNDSKEPLINNN